MATNRKHGVSAATYKKFIIDSGAVYLGFTDFSTLGTLLGATRGGNVFNIEQEIKEMEVDGARGPVKGGRRIVGVKATLTVNFIEHTLDGLKRMLAGSDSAVFDVSWDQITRALVIEDADFLSDITIIGETTNASTEKAMGIQLTDCLVDSNFELNFEDKEEGIIPATFTAHLDPATFGVGGDDDTEPWSLLWPTQA